MAKKQLGVAPSVSNDAATKGYVDGLSTATGKSIMTAADAAAAAVGHQHLALVALVALAATMAVAVAVAVVVHL